MEVIYGPNAANFQITSQKRLLRPVMAQTEGFPYPAFLDPSLRYSSTGANPGFVRVPTSGDAAGTTYGSGPSPFHYDATSFTLQGSLTPGLVMVKSTYGSGGAGGDYATVSPGQGSSNTTPALQPWGLLGQWLGGTFDGVGQNSGIGVWMGPDSEYEILAPGWNDTGMGTAVAGQAAGTQLLLYAGSDGRLCVAATLSGGAAVANAQPVARLIDRVAGSRIVVQLLI